MLKKCTEGNISIKMDIKKAFDKLRWSLLLKVLESFGFCDRFCRLIETIFLPARIYFLLKVCQNGTFLRGFASVTHFLFSFWFS